MIGFLTSLRAALEGLVGALERQAAAIDAAANPYPALAVEHGLAVHRASLAWADAGDRPAGGILPGAEGEAA